MLSTTINIILLIALAIAAFIVLQRMRGYTKAKYVPPVSSLTAIAKNTNMPIKKEEVSLTLQDKIKLSWQFLTNITEQVIKRFSTQDQQQIYKAGQELIKHGAKYEHDVHQEVNFTQKTATAKVVQQDKEQIQSRSR